MPPSLELSRNPGHIHNAPRAHADPVFLGGNLAEKQGHFHSLDRPGEVDEVLGHGHGRPGLLQHLLGYHYGAYPTLLQKVCGEVLE
jgi:hypothetical protein